MDGFEYNENDPIADLALRFLRIGRFIIDFVWPMITLDRCDKDGVSNAEVLRRRDNCDDAFKGDASLFLFKLLFDRRFEENE